MGRGMASNLLDKSFAGSQGAWGDEAARKGERGAFVVYDAFPSALNQFLSSHTNAFAGRDVLPASSPAGATRLASTIVTMLPSSKEVEEVYLGENGIREALEGMSSEQRSETLLIDCTTGDREEAIRVAREMESLGVKMVDAPVSGGVVGAEKGTLSFMVGGSEEACARSLLVSIARRRLTVGRPTASPRRNLSSRKWARGTSTAARQATDCAFRPRAPHVSRLTNRLMQGGQDLQQVRLARLFAPRRDLSD